MFNHRPVDLPLCMISGKAVEYKLFWIGNEKSLGGMGIFLGNKVFDISRISDKMFFINVFVQEIIISVISVYGLQCGFDDGPKDHFYDSLINVKKFWEKEIGVIPGGFKVHVGSKPEGYDNQHHG